MIALRKIMIMKGPSGKSPCRACNIYSIKFLGNEQGRGKIQYYPHLFKPDPLNLQQLPLQRHVWQTIRDVCIANKPNLFQDSGITGMSILLELRTIHFTKSFPNDTMHMILQNITEQIYKLWSGTREIDVREGMDFVLSKNMLDEIGQHMWNSWPEIPTALGQAPHNIFKHAKSFKVKE